MRPKTHWRRFQHERVAIIKSLKSKIVHNRWTKDCSHQIQQYWFRGLKRQLQRIGQAERITAVRLKKLLADGVIAATHSLHWFQMTYQPPIAFVAAA
jgi:hypothetical protein